MANFFEISLFFNITVIIFGLFYFLSHRKFRGFYRVGLSHLSNLKSPLRIEFALFCGAIGLFQWLYWQFVIRSLSGLDLNLATLAIGVASFCGALIGIIPSKQKVVWPLHWLVTVLMFVLTYVGFILTSLSLPNSIFHSWIPLIVSLIFVAFNLILLFKHRFSVITEIGYLVSLMGWDLVFWLMTKGLF